MLNGIPSTFSVDATVMKQTGLLVNPGNFIYKSKDAFDKEGDEIIIEY